MWQRISNALTVATIVGLLMAVLGFAARISALGSVFCFSVAFGSSYLASGNLLLQRIRSAGISVSFIIAIVLTAVLAGILLRQRWINSQGIVDIGEAADTLRWKLQWCSIVQRDCVDDALYKLQDSMQPASHQASDKLFVDQALGQVVRTSDKTMKLLHDTYGIYKDSFLGTGESLPAGATDFTAQRIPEYLVPNYRDDHPNLISWKLQIGDPWIDRKLSDLLGREPLTPKQNIDKVRKEIKSHIRNPQEPALIRFALVPDLKRGIEAGQYSHCLGLPARRRVFFSSLDFMIKSTTSVRQASELSGYKFETGKPNEIQYLYVFMFVPANPDERLEPTWRALLTHVHEPSACQ